MYSFTVYKLCFILQVCVLFHLFKDRQHRITADLQHSRLSLTYSLTSWVEMCTKYDKIDNLERYLGI